MYNGQVAQTYYAASNGGQMIASDMYWNTKVPYEQRQHIPYLVTKDDPWTKATGEPLKGHPVGMSQYGARYAAGMGLDHKVILAFYYPGTTLLPETVYIPPVNPAPAPKPIPTKPITAIPEKYLYKATAATLQPFSLNIWTGISKYASLGKIPRGKEVYVLDIINDGWVRVQYGTKIGFVDRRYLHEPMRNDVLYRAEVKTFYPLSLNIWKEARKGQSLIKVPRGATIEVLKEVNQVWAQVRYGKYVGYSDMKYLKKVEDK